jgi:hypothetical protein
MAPWEASSGERISVQQLKGLVNAVIGNLSHFSGYATYLKFHSANLEINADSSSQT